MRQWSLSRRCNTEEKEILYAYITLSHSDYRHAISSLSSHVPCTPSFPNTTATHPLSSHHPHALSLTPNISISTCSRHAEIYWEAADKSFYIRNISTEWHTPLATGTGRGGDGVVGAGTGSGPRGGSLYVRGEEVFPGDRGVPLKSQTVVQVGSVIFTFVLPSSKAAAHKQDIDVSAMYRVLLHCQLFHVHRMFLRHVKVIYEY